jgi:hypothetical protein
MILVITLLVVHSPYESKTNVPVGSSVVTGLGLEILNPVFGIPPVTLT